MQDSQGGDESDPAEGVRRRCMNNSPSVLSCIGNVAAKSRQFTAHKTRKGQFLRANRMNLT